MAITPRSDLGDQAQGVVPGDDLESSVDVEPVARFVLEHEFLEVEPLDPSAAFDQSDRVIERVAGPGVNTDAPVAHRVDGDLEGQRGSREVEHHGVVLGDRRLSRGHGVDRAEMQNPQVLDVEGQSVETGPDTHDTLTGT